MGTQDADDHAPRLSGPGLVLMPGLDAELVRILTACGVAVTVSPDATDALRAARERGAALVVPPEALGAVPVTAASQHGPLSALSRRELEVLRLVAAGRENSEIARELVISPRTVKNHLSSILAKLGLANRVQAAVLAVHCGLEVS